MGMNINTLVLINVAYLIIFIALSVKEVLWLRLNSIPTDDITLEITK